MLRRVFQSLIAAGAIGFFGGMFLPNAGPWLERVELPAFFQTSTIALPDGGRLTATIPLQRVQRYGGNGRFQSGWFVEAKGGHFAIGLTQEGKAAVCTGRGRQLFIFELDGRHAGDPAPCIAAPRDVPQILQPADLAEGKIKLLPVARAASPPPALIPTLLVPFWHPFVAWAMALAGFLGLRSVR
jgi:hypothetical protein